MEDILELDYEDDPIEQPSEQCVPPSPSCDESEDDSESFLDIDDLECVDEEVEEDKIIEDRKRKEGNQQRRRRDEEKRRPDETQEEFLERLRVREKLRLEYLESRRKEEEVEPRHRETSHRNDRRGNGRREREERHRGQRSIRERRNLRKSPIRRGKRVVERRRTRSPSQERRIYRSGKLLLANEDRSQISPVTLPSENCLANRVHPNGKEETDRCDDECVNSNDVFNNGNVDRSPPSSTHRVIGRSDDHTTVTSTSDVHPRDKDYKYRSGVHGETSRLHDRVRNRETTDDVVTTTSTMKDVAHSRVHGHPVRDTMRKEEDMNGRDDKRKKEEREEEERDGRDQKEKTDNRSGERRDKERLRRVDALGEERNSERLKRDDVRTIEARDGERVRRDHRLQHIAEEARKQWRDRSEESRHIEEVPDVIKVVGPLANGWYEDPDETPRSESAMARSPTPLRDIEGEKNERRDDEKIGGERKRTPERPRSRQQLGNQQDEYKRFQREKGRSGRRTEDSFKGGRRRRSPEVRRERSRSPAEKRRKLSNEKVPSSCSSSIENRSPRRKEEMRSEQNVQTPISEDIQKIVRMRQQMYATPVKKDTVSSTTIASPSTSTTDKPPSTKKTSPTIFSRVSMESMPSSSSSLVLVPSTLSSLLPTAKSPSKAIPDVVPSTQHVPTVTVVAEDLPRKRVRIPILPPDGCSKKCVLPQDASRTGKGGKVNGGISSSSRTSASHNDSHNVFQRETTASAGEKMSRKDFSNIFKAVRSIGGNSESGKLQSPSDVVIKVEGKQEVSSNSTIAEKVDTVASPPPTRKPITMDGFDRREKEREKPRPQKMTQIVVRGSPERIERIQTKKLPLPIWKPRGHGTKKDPSNTVPHDREIVIRGSSSREVIVGDDLEEENEKNREGRGVSVVVDSMRRVTMDNREKRREEREIVICSDLSPPRPIPSQSRRKQKKFRTLIVR